MKKEKTKKKPTKTDEDLKGSVAAHLVIKDAKTGNVILNTRG